VKDLRSRVAELKQAGVRFRGEIVSGPGGTKILVEDPDENPIELFEPARAAQQGAPADGFAAAELVRVCRAWHEASRVKVPIPGIRRAEG